MPVKTSEDYTIAIFLGEAFSFILFRNNIDNWFNNNDDWKYILAFLNILRESITNMISSVV